MLNEYINYIIIKMETGNKKSDRIKGLALYLNNPLLYSESFLELNMNVSCIFTDVHIRTNV